MQLPLMGGQWFCITVDPSAAPDAAAAAAREGVKKTAPMIAHPPLMWPSSTRISRLDSFVYNEARAARHCCTLVVDGFRLAQ